MFLLKYDFCRASNHILSVKRHVLSKYARDFIFFAISEAKRSSFFSIKDFSFCSFVSPCLATRNFKCVFGEVCLIPDTER